MRRFLSLAFGFAAVLWSAHSWAQPRRVEARRVPAGTITIDGQVTDPGWRGRQRAGGFVQRSPYDGAAPTEPTAVSVVYDDEALYVLVEASDSRADEIHARLTRRDEGSASDWIHLYLDTHDDDRTGYRFSVNPLGVKLDARLSNDNDEERSWNAVWEAETSRTSRGWTVEYRIPLSQLRYDPRRTTWGFQVARMLRRESETSFFNPNPKSSSRRVSHFGSLGSLYGLPDPWHVLLVPYARGSIENDDGEWSPHWGIGGDLR
ncbi:carbohydrate binding family 9 domain-containing protein, partial [Desulfobulbus sp. AH-315-M07]|nr:carbohydrate binding family 9 domain-containing protein [Desulfobulbus sp. AH-315-M07]